MTGQELIDWIKKHNAEDAVIEIQYRDDGGFYSGTEDEIVPAIIDKNVIPKCRYTPVREYKRIVL